MAYKDPEKIREARRKYREANREKILEAKRKYREANPEKQREGKRKCYQDAKVIADISGVPITHLIGNLSKSQSKYYAANRDKKLVYLREYRETNREKQLEYQRQYRATKKAQREQAAKV